MKTTPESLLPRAWQVSRICLNDGCIRGSIRYGVTKMLPIIMPDAQIVKRCSRRGSRETVTSLCLKAGIACRVTGPAADRKVWVLATQGSLPEHIEREPGAYGPVFIKVAGKTIRRRSFKALGFLAYVVFDYASRESLRGLPEARMVGPVGRPRQAHSLSGAERQRRFRNKHKSEKSGFASVKVKSEFLQVVREVRESQARDALRGAACVFPLKDRALQVVAEYRF